MVDFDISTGVKNLFEKIRGQTKMTHFSIVLVSAAILDRQLERVLKKAMRPLSNKFYDRLFEGSSGPLSNFANKILMARALGIITTDIYGDLETIRRIRNKFAHSSQILNFESKEIAPELLALKKEKTTKTNPSDLFVNCVGVIDEFLEAYLVRTGKPQEKDNTPA